MKKKKKKKTEESLIIQVWFDSQRKSEGLGVLLKDTKAKACFSNS